MNVGDTYSPYQPNIGERVGSPVGGPDLFALAVQSQRPLSAADDIELLRIQAGDDMRCEGLGSTT